MRTLPILLLALFICRTGFALDLKATDFGVQADGKTDDGPAILKMIEKARAQDGKAVRLIFPKAKTIYAATGKDRYLFPLQKTKDITLEGSGSTFLLHPNIRFHGEVKLGKCEEPGIEGNTLDGKPFRLQ